MRFRFQFFLQLLPDKFFSRSSPSFGVSGSFMYWSIRSLMFSLTSFSVFPWVAKSRIDERAEV